MKQSILLSILIWASVSPLKSQEVTIPDANFRHALIEEGVDTNGDGIISHQEAKGILKLDVSYQEIHNLEGIEAFINLLELDCSKNYLTELTLNQIGKLESLVCYDNQISYLDLSGNTALKHLNCTFNKLTDLNLSENKALNELACGVNQLGFLDVSNNRELTLLDCRDTRLTSLNVSRNKALEILKCGFNNMGSLDFSENMLLSDLDCSVNQLRELDISHNSSLRYLNCSFNHLSDLDVSANRSLHILGCGYNRLTTIDISNNTVLEKVYFGGLPLLTEVCVWSLPFPLSDIEVYAPDSPDLFYKDCRAPQLSISDVQHPSESMEINSSEDGMVYLVPGEIDDEIQIIRSCCIDSFYLFANTALTVSLSKLENGTYRFYARDSSGNISLPVEFIFTGSNLVSDKGESMRIFPNPTNQFLIIQALRMADKYCIEVLSLSGCIVQRDVFAGGTFFVDLSSLEKGIYSIRIRSKDIVTTRKIIKL